MSHFKITVQDMQLAFQILGSLEEHLVARAIVTIERNGKHVIDAPVDIKQTPGGIDTASDLEVGWPAGYNGPFDYQVFRKEIAAYYLRLVGDEGQILKVGPGVEAAGIEGFSMRLETPYSFEFDTID